MAKCAPFCLNVDGIKVPKYFGTLINNSLLKNYTTLQKPPVCVHTEREDK